MTLPSDARPLPDPALRQHGAEPPRRSAVDWLPDRRWWLWLLLAGAFGVVANGRWVVPAATWLAPFFLVRLLRTRSRGVALVLGFVLFYAVNAVSWYGVVPATGVLYGVALVPLSLFAFLPFAIDRALRRSFPGFSGTFLLPLMSVSLELVGCWFPISPFGAWGSVAYTQSGNLPLLQLVALTGATGITFLVNWTAAVVNWAWAHSFRPAEVKHGAAVFCGAMLLVWSAGGIRLALGRPEGSTVRIAAVTGTPVGTSRPDSTAAPGTERHPDAMRVRFLRHQDGLIEASRREARAGARIVLWPEYSGFTFRDDEPSFVARGEALAREEGIYLFMSLIVVTPGERLRQNKVVVVDPSGETILEYHKIHPVPGEGIARGREPIPVLATSYGRIGVAICFDLDFPHQVQQAAYRGIDLMLSPAQDWPPIDPLHTQMAVVRAVENGFNLVRHAKMGLSVAADAHGRILGAVDGNRSGELVMVAQVPTRGTSTPYRVAGSFFAWCCLVALSAVSIRALGRERKGPHAAGV